MASRIAYGEEVTLEKLEQVEKAEDFLYGLLLDYQLAWHLVMIIMKVCLQEQVRWTSILETLNLIKICQ